MEPIVDTQKSANYGFPSHEISPLKKNKQWCLQYMKAFNKEFTQGGTQILRAAFDNYQEYRMYARGKQSIDQYKDLLGVSKRHGKKDMSWRNLDWNILPIFPRFKRVIKNRLKKLPREILLSAIDQTSINEKNDRYSNIVEYMVNKKFHNDVGQNLSGYRPEVPFEAGEPQPDNTGEIPMYMEMYPKNRYIMYMKDQIDMAFLQSDWKQMEDELLDDLIEVGVGATRTYIDVLGRVRIRRMRPEQTISNICIKNDFSDLIRVGEYVTMSISDLRASVPAGTFEDADYAKMASQISGRQYSPIGVQAYFAVNNCYPWDHERITVLQAEWYSADDVAYVVAKNTGGNMVMSKRENPDWLKKKGLTDAEYAMFYKKKGEERTIERDTVNNVYQSSWVVGTEYIYDYGRQSNMIRAINSINDCHLSTSMYTLDFDSYVRQCIPILDNIQVNWLQYQHHLAQSKPKGVAIERRALSMVEVGGRKLKLKDILQMYAETGSFIYVGTDQGGRPYPFKPLEELEGGISEAAQGHLDFIIRQIDILRMVLGLSELTDGSAPDPKTPKFAAEEAISNTDNALGDLYHGFINIFENTARRVCMLVPDAELMGRSVGKEQALGADAHQYIINKRFIGLMDFAIKIEAGITQDLRARLSEHINVSLKINGGVLLPEDAFLIENEKNIFRAYQLLAQKRRQREAEIQKNEIQKMNVQADGQAQILERGEAAKQQTMQTELEMFKEKTALEMQKELTVIREQGTINLLLEKVKIQSELSSDEQAIYADILKTRMKGEYDIQKAEIAAKAKKAQAKKSA